MRFEAPPAPPPLDVYKPLVVIEAEETWERYYADNKDFVDAYAYEWCRWCCTLIGKDYGSFGHSCEAKEAYLRYIRPVMAHEREVKDWELEVRRCEIGNRLLDSGMEFDKAERMIHRASDANLDDIVTLLEL